MKHITILGRRWFQRSYGNTYCTVGIYVDGELVHTLPKTYGYDNYYYQAAGEWLDANGYVKLEKYPNGSMEPLHALRDRGEITLVYQATDVARERDL